MSQNRIELSRVAGVGPKLELAYKKLGLITVKDLIYFLPKKIIDLSLPLPINSARTKIDEEVIVEGKIKGLSVIRTRHKRMWVVEGIIEDSTGAIEVIWYNQPYLYKSLKLVSDNLILKGQLVKNNAKIVLNSPEIYKAKGLYPVYRQTKNLTSKIISKTIAKVLKPSLMPEDLLPLEVAEQFGLPDLFMAAKYCHQPQAAKYFKAGRYRFLFEELFLFMLVNLKIKFEFEKENPPQISIPSSIDKLIRKLPFELTGDQIKVFDEIKEDFKKPYPMNRIIQGDVGSGKTIIAFLAAITAAESGYQTAIMAPTEILAIQHYNNFCSLKKILKLHSLGISLNTSKNKKSDGGDNIIIGTHALLNYDFKNLGLVVVDEQQRFGVEQRTILLESQSFMPHYLSLSATPIPRSLAHVIFSNCDLSQIKQKPKDRIKIKTYLIPERKRSDTYEFIDKLIDQREQVFIVCPIISQGDLDDDKKSVESVVRGLGKTILGRRRIGFLHGRLKSEEKEKVLTEFSAGEIDILVSTSVIEVGIDIKNASVMLIEDAQMFGLAQLHQIRGRVGRGDKQSYCFAFAKIEDNENSRARLKAFVRSEDGFELSNYDLKLRGPGSFFNVNQSGYSGINPLWFEDTKLLKDCSEAAKQIIGRLEEFSSLNQIVNDKIVVRHLD